MSEVSLPHDLGAERAVLGAILIDNRELDTAHTLALVAEQFFRDAHQRIFRAILALEGRRSALDFITVKAELERAGDLDEVGASYLASVIDGGVRSTNLRHYVGLIQAHAARRGVMLLCRRVLEQAAACEEAVSTVLDGAVHGLLDISQRTERGQLVEGAELAGEAIAYLEELAKRRSNRHVAGISTGFHALDQMTDGFHPGQLIIVAARPAQGKSAIALQFALASESCAFFSLEMTRMELAIRELAVLGRVDGWALRKGYLSAVEQHRVSRALEALAESGVAIDDTPGLSVAQLRAKARRRQVTHGLACVVVDYVQLMTAGVAHRKDVNREQEVAAVARGLKSTAKELSVPVIALAQLNRAVEQGREKAPTLGNLRESGALEQDADVVIFVHRQDGQTVAREGDVQLIVAKNRTGPSGTVELRWYPSQTRFGDPETVEREPQQGAFA